MSKRHQASRRRTYGRRQHEIRERRERDWRVDGIEKDRRRRRLCADGGADLGVPGVRLRRHLARARVVAGYAGARPRSGLLGRRGASLPRELSGDPRSGTLARRRVRSGTASRARRRIWPDRHPRRGHRRDVRARVRLAGPDGARLGHAGGAGSPVDGGRDPPGRAGPDQVEPRPARARAGGPQDRARRRPGPARRSARHPGSLTPCWAGPTAVVARCCCSSASSCSGRCAWGGWPTGSWPGTIGSSRRRASRRSFARRFPRIAGRSTTAAGR